MRVLSNKIGGRPAAGLAIMLAAKAGDRTGDPLQPTAVLLPVRMRLLQHTATCCRRAHMTGCCVRPVMLALCCTSCGYWLPDTAAARGGAPDASASRASVNSTSSCHGRFLTGDRRLTVLLLDRSCTAQPASWKRTLLTICLRKVCAQHVTLGGHSPCRSRRRAPATASAPPCMQTPADNQQSQF